MGFSGRLWQRWHLPTGQRAVAPPSAPALAHVALHRQDTHHLLVLGHFQPLVSGSKPRLPQSCGWWSVLVEGSWGREEAAGTV